MASRSCQRNGQRQAHTVQSRVRRKIAGLPWQSTGFELARPRKRPSAKITGLTEIARGMPSLGHVAARCYLSSINPPTVGEFIATRLSPKAPLFGRLDHHLAGRSLLIAAEILPALRGALVLEPPVLEALCRSRRRVLCRLNNGRASFSNSAPVARSFLAYRVCLCFWGSWEYGNQDSLRYQRQHPKRKSSSIAPYKIL